VARTLPKRPQTRRRKPFIVAVVGGSGAGKTWLADMLCGRLAPNAARLSLDSFYRDRSHLPAARRARLNFDHPHSIDWPALEMVLRELAAGKAAVCPGYDFETHCRRPKGVLIRPRPIVIVDGLWLLRRGAIRRIWGMSIFVDCPTRTRLERRLKRDVQSRGRTEASVREQFKATVEPMHRRYVAPQMKWADEILSGTCGEAVIERLANVVRQRAGMQIL
jgi:uridine kinase